MKKAGINDIPREKQRYYVRNSNAAKIASFFDFGQPASHIDPTSHRPYCNERRWKLVAPRRDARTIPPITDAKAPVIASGFAPVFGNEPALAAATVFAELTLPAATTPLGAPPWPPLGGVWAVLPPHEESTLVLVLLLLLAVPDVALPALVLLEVLAVPEVEFWVLLLVTLALFSQVTVVVFVCVLVHVFVEPGPVVLMEQSAAAALAPKALTETIAAAAILSNLFMSSSP